MFRINCRLSNRLNGKKQTVTTYTKALEIWARLPDNSLGQFS
jgi:hypothetical protein